MQYKGFRRMKKIAAVILSSALVVTSLPQSSIVNATQISEEQEETSEIESNSTPENNIAEENSSTLENNIAEESNSTPISSKENAAEGGSIEESDTEENSASDTSSLPEESSITEQNSTAPQESDTAEQNSEAAEEGSTEEQNSNAPQESSTAEQENNTPEESSTTEQNSEAPEESSNTEQNSEAPEENDTTEQESEISEESSTTEQESEIPEESSTTEQESEMLEEESIPVPIVDTSIYSMPEIEAAEEESWDFLAAQGYEPAEELTIAEDGSYTIDSKGKFTTFLSDPSAYADKTVSLACDIDMKNEVALFNAAFKGTFNGNGHSIHHVKIQNGLFLSISSGAEVKNLHISNAVVSGENSVGSIAARNMGTISNCAVTGNIKVTGSVYELAGIVGMNSGKIEQCAFAGNIDVSGGNASYAGGIAGTNTGTMEACYAMGKIVSDSGITGGIVGDNFQTVSNCANYMDVSGQDAAGGITAENAGEISGCENYGTITKNAVSSSQAGGIAGGNTKSGRISTSYNYGEVNGKGNNIAGIAGYTCGDITDCGNYGKITGAANVGGVAGLYKGDSSKTISASFNQGELNGNGSGDAAKGIGGILGSSDTAGIIEIKNCYNTGTISINEATNYVGGIAGILEKGSITNSHNAGVLPSTNNTSSACVGGIAGFLKDSATCEGCYFSSEKVDAIYYQEQDIDGEKKVVPVESGQYKVSASELDNKIAGKRDAEKKYLIVYEPNGGCLEAYFAKDTVAALPAPTMKSANFAGWYLDAGFQKPFEGGSVKEAAVIYAKWEKFTSATSIELSQTSAILYPEKTLEITAAVKPEGAKNTRLKWESDDSELVTVSTSAEDSTKVTITAGLKTGTANITVSVENDPAVSAQLSVSVVPVGTTFIQRLDTGEAINAEVNKAGIAKNFAVNDVIEIGVKYDTERYKNIQFQWAAGEGKHFLLKAEENDLEKTTITGSNEKVFIVGKASGTDTLTLVLTDKTTNELVMKALTCNITVAPQASSVEIKLDGETVAEDVTYDIVTEKFVAIGNRKLDLPVEELTAQVHPKDAKQEVQWKSDNESAVKFNDSDIGIVESATTGDAKVTASAQDGSNVKKEITVHARRIVQSFTMKESTTDSKVPVVKDENGNIVLTSGNSIKLTPVFVPADPSNLSLQFSITGDKNAIKIETNNPQSNSNIKTIATVSANKVSENTKITVTATARDVGRASCEINFIIKPQVERINIYKSDNMNMPVNDETIGINPETDAMSFTLKVKNLPENASQMVTWESNNTKVAEVEDNHDGSCKVTGLTKGIAVITATAADGSGVTAITMVSVTTLATDILITGSNHVMKGKTITLKAEIYPKSAANQSVTWKSLMPAIASVEKNTGKVTGKSAGTAVIVATAADGSGASATHTVRVTDVIKNFDIITSDSSSDTTEYTILTGKSVGLDPDDGIGTKKLSVRILPETASQTVTWESGNEKVVKVENGILTAVSLGTATVTAKATDGSGRNASVTVYVTTLVKSIQIKGSHYVGKNNKTIQLTAEVGDRDAVNKNVIWTSQHPNIATVDSEGVVTGIKGDGHTVITAEAADGSGVKQTHDIYIIGANNKIEIASYNDTIEIKKDKNKKKYIDIDMSDYETLDLTAAFDGGTTENSEYPMDVAWSSSNKNIATVESTGIRRATVTFLKKGSVTITATAMDGTGVKDTCKLNVANKEPKIKITGPKQVARGKKIQLSVGGAEVNWESSDKTIATVNAKGLVTAKKTTGQVVIKADSNECNNYDTYVINVADPVHSVSIYANGADVTGEKLSLDIVKEYNGKQLDLDAVLDGDDNENVTWKSSKTSVATVDADGKITIKKNGTAKITATAIDGSKKKGTVTLVISKQVTSIEPANGVDEIKVGLKKSAQLKVAFKPLAATTKKVKWESNAPGYVSVNKSTGKITAKRMPSNPDEYVTITARATENDSIFCTFKVYVTNPVNKVEVVEKEKDTLREYCSTVGIDLSTAFAASPATIQLDTNLKDKNGNILKNQNVTWKSSNSKIAKVDENGLVTGIAKGKATITATACDGTKKTGKVTVYVGKLIQSMELKGDLEKGLIIPKGKSKTVAADIRIAPITATNQTLSYTSSNKKIATVSSKGKITGKKAGIVEITVKTTDGSNLQETFTVQIK